MPLIGTHINSDISKVNNIDQIYKYGGNLIQIFTSPNNKIKDYDKLIKKIKKYNIEVIIHSSYALNIAQPLNIYSWQIRYIIQETQLMKLLNSKYIVIHLGKKLNLPLTDAIQNMFDNIIYLVNNTSNDITFLIETSSGQGSELLYDLNDFAIFYKKLLEKIKNKNKIGICLDTCHIYQAGWDISSIDNFNNIMENFQNIIGIDHIKLVHLNNSIYKLGDRKDRHAALDNGSINEQIMLYIGKYFMERNIRIILETPFNKNELVKLKKIITN